MRAKYIGNKADRLIFNTKNAEASATIALGAPVIFNLSSTANADDGLAVVNPSTAGAGAYQLGSGVNCTYNLANNTMGEAIVYGFCASTLVKLGTRATSTDSWASIAAIASGVLLVPDFTNNVWQTLANVAAQSSPGVILLDAVASLALVASAAGVTKVVSTGMYRSFVRLI